MLHWLYLLHVKHPDHVNSSWCLHNNKLKYWPKSWVQSYKTRTNQHKKHQKASGLIFPDKQCLTERRQQLADNASARQWPRFRSANGCQLVWRCPHCCFSFEQTKLWSTAVKQETPPASSYLTEYATLHCLIIITTECRSKCCNSHQWSASQSTAGMVSIENQKNHKVKI